MKTKKIECLRLVQPGATLYTVSMSGKEVLNRLDVMRRADDRDAGIQRILKPSRCKRIGWFYSQRDAILPNNIIASAQPEEVRFEAAENDSNHGWLHISDNAKFMVIDGQHRGFGWRYAERDFPVQLTLLIGTDRRTQAKLFYTINREAKKINPSLAYDLLGIIKPGTEEEKLAGVISALNDDADSPLHGLVRMTDAPDGDTIITQANIISKLVQFRRTPPGRWFNAMDGIGEITVNENSLIRVLKEYFESVQELKPDDWGNRESILTKTLGFGALMKLLPDVLTESRVRFRKTDRMTFRKLLEPIRNFDFRSSDIASLGGEKGQQELRDRLADHIGLYEETVV